MEEDPGDPGRARTPVDLLGDMTDERDALKRHAANCEAAIAALHTLIKTVADVLDEDGQSLAAALMRVQAQQIARVLPP